MTMTTIEMMIIVSLFVLAVAIPTVLLFGETQKVPQNASLATYDRGTVCQFDYRQPLTGEVRRYNVTILDKCKLDPGWIRVTNRRSNYRRGDRDFKRTPTLLMCMTPDGVRQFYAERAENVRVRYFRTLYNRIRGVAA
jgi:hypothetical protein